MKKNDSYNGFIDIVRLFFAVCVAIGHYGGFKNSYIFVDFFFVLSGYFMVKTSEKKQSDDIIEDTLIFLKNKISVFLPYLYITFFLVFIGDYFIFSENRYPLLEYIHIFFLYIWELLLCSMSGLGLSSLLVGVGWYLSAMVICMAICYPLLLKDKKLFRYIISPLGFIIIQGFLSRKLGNIAVVYTEDGMPYYGLLRALSDILGGGIAFNLSLVIERENKQITYTIIEILIWIFSFISTIKWGYTDFDYIIILSFVIVISITMSGTSMVSRMFNNRRLVLFGKLSLVLYLSHLYIGKYMVQLQVFSIKNAIIVSLLFSLMEIYIVYLLKNMFKRLLRKKELAH